MPGFDLADQTRANALVLIDCDLVGCVELVDVPDTADRASVSTSEPGAGR